MPMGNPLYQVRRKTPNPQGKEGRRQNRYRVTYLL